MDAIKYVHEQLSEKKELPAFRPGDSIEMSYKIKEGAKERIQKFKGIVIQINGEGSTKTFTIRKTSGNVGVERIIPLNSPLIDEIKILKKGKVRRAKLYYQRERLGKKARIKERKQG